DGDPEGADLGRAALQRMRRTAGAIPCRGVGGLGRRSDRHKVFAAFVDENLQHRARAVGADAVEQLVEHVAVDQRRLGHSATNFLPLPMSLCCGSRTDLAGSATACPITDACRPWAARIASVASASAVATTTQKPIPMLKTSNISARETPPCSSIRSKIGGGAGKLRSEERRVGKECRSRGAAYH